LAWIKGFSAMKKYENEDNKKKFTADQRAKRKTSGLRRKERAKTRDQKALSYA